MRNSAAKLWAFWECCILYAEPEVFGESGGYECLWCQGRTFCMTAKQQLLAVGVYPKRLPWSCSFIKHTSLQLRFYAKFHFATQICHCRESLFLVHLLNGSQKLWLKLKGNAKLNHLKDKSKFDCSTFLLTVLLSWHTQRNFSNLLQIRFFGFMFSSSHSQSLI